MVKNHGLKRVVVELELVLFVLQYLLVVVAFLAMDLDFLMQHELSKGFVEHYIRFSDDKGLREMLPFYLYYRAFVRGKVESFRINDQATPFAERMNALLRAQRYFFLAERYAKEM